MGTDPRIAVISWAVHQNRTSDWANCLNAPIYFIHSSILGQSSKVSAPLRYLLQTDETWKVLESQRPRLIFVTNPPIFAALVVYFYCIQSGARFIMDTHSPALYSRRWRWTLLLQRWIARKALINILDQPRYKQLFESWGGRAAVQQDFHGSFKQPAGVLARSKERLEVTVVNTFATDEPLDPILQAAPQLPQVHFFILGDTRLAPKKMLDHAPDNITFTGYLLNEAYWQRLKRSHAVMCLTIFPYSLLAGAQDGLMVDTPLILSRQPALTEYFTQGTIFIDNTMRGVIQGVEELRRKQKILDEEIVALRIEKEEEWQRNFRYITEVITEDLWKQEPLHT